MCWRASAPVFLKAWCLKRLTCASFMVQMWYSIPCSSHTQMSTRREPLSTYYPSLILHRASICYPALQSCLPRHGRWVTEAPFRCIAVSRSDSRSQRPTKEVRIVHAAQGRPISLASNGTFTANPTVSDAIHQNSAMKFKWTFWACGGDWASGTNASRCSFAKERLPRSIGKYLPYKINSQHQPWLTRVSSRLKRFTKASCGRCWADGIFQRSPKRLWVSHVVPILWPSRSGWCGKPNTKPQQSVKWRSNNG